MRAGSWKASMFGFVLYCLSCSQATPPDVKTPDTTSNNFTWTTQTFGDGASSALFDVAIVNDTLAFAVGGVYTNDTNGNLDSQPRNLAVWNGQNWRLQKLNYEGYPPVIRSIYAVSERNVWLDPWFHWDGQSFSERNIDPLLIGVRINRMWGNSATLYVAGDNGFIGCYNGSSWQSIETNTALPINDVWGAYDWQIGQWEILAVASNKHQNLGKKMLWISANAATAIVDSGLSWSLSSVYFVPGGNYYVVGDGEFEFSNLKSTGVWQLWPSGKTTNFYSEQIRGVGSNDIFIVGDYGEVVHYNGKRWVNFTSQTGFTVGYYLSVALRGNLAIAVGQSGNNAIAAIGRR